MFVSGGLWGAALSVGLLAAVGSAPLARADVTLGGITYHTTEPADASHGTVVEIDGSALTFLAQWDTVNQGNATVSAETLAFLTSQGFTGVTYLGRQDGSGALPGTGVTTVSSDGGLSGTWTFTPGSSGDVAGFIAIHAGGGQNEILYKINSPGLSGIWDTSENTVGPGNQAALSNFDLFGGPGTICIGLTCGGTTGEIPEPSSSALLGVGLLGLCWLARRLKA